MLFSYFLILIIAPDLLFARLGHGRRGPTSHIVNHGMFLGGFPKYTSTFERKAPLDRRQASNPTSCASGTGNRLTTKAPKANIFAGLADDEAAAVTSFLHSQKSLNLTAAATATR